MKKQNKSYKVLGVMSGTSFDGIDFCLAEFWQLEEEWKYKILFAETLDYDENWKERILKGETEKGANLIQLHFEYGNLLGRLAKKVLQKNNQDADLISSHGHTLFHQIENGFTFQLGNGASIAARSGIKTICDFRSTDVALGGQGAPLVPYGDMHLFPDYDCCINLGGIANTSFQKLEKRLAFDIVPVNMILNHFYQLEYEGLYDDKGVISKSGNFHELLYSELNNVSFYHENAPKSIGKEWVFETLVPILENSKISIADLLHTYSHHIAFQIKNVLDNYSISNSVLITGGGAKNEFLMQLLKEKDIKVKAVNETTIDFKEALIFAFLGLNRLLENTNTLKSVTGATRDSSGGAIYLP